MSHPSSLPSRPTNSLTITSAAATSGRASDTTNARDTGLRVGTVVANRYTLSEAAVIGNYGTVVRAVDTRSQSCVALKLLPCPINALTNDERVFALIRSDIAQSRSLFAEPFDVGQHNTLRYLAFNHPYFTLLDVVFRADLHPLPTRHLREIGLQMLRGIQFLHSLGLVHADLRPMNIVLRSADMTRVRRMRCDGYFVSQTRLLSVELYFINFDDARLVKGSMKGFIGTDSYRAPEVTLGLPWDARVDVFPIGCIMAELYLGRLLFYCTQSKLERLALLERVLGMFPRSVALRTERVTPDVFLLAPYIKVNYPPDTEEPTDRMRALLSASPLSGVVHDKHFYDMCASLMNLDALQRGSAESYLAHPFLNRCGDDVMDAGFRG